MNRKVRHIFCVFLLLVASSFLLEAKEKIAIRVDGLSCAFCAYGLENNLKELEGVEKVEINLKDGIASLILKEGKDITDKTLRKVVKDSGFTPREIKREQPAKKETSHMETIKLNVTGMSCSGCVYNVKTALEKLSSINEVEVDLQSGTASVKFEKGKVTASQLIDAIEKAG